jgi:hypothetical protein
MKRQVWVGGDFWIASGVKLTLFVNTSKNPLVDNEH